MRTLRSMLTAVPCFCASFGPYGNISSFLHFRLEDPQSKLTLCKWDMSWGPLSIQELSEVNFTAPQVSWPHQDFCEFPVDLHSQGHLVLTLFYPWDIQLPFWFPTENCMCSKHFELKRFTECVLRQCLHVAEKTTWTGMVDMMRYGFPWNEWSFMGSYLPMFLSKICPDLKFGVLLFLTKTTRIV